MIPTSANQLRHTQSFIKFMHVNPISFTFHGRSVHRLRTRKALKKKKKRRINLSHWQTREQHTSPEAKPLFLSASIGLPSVTRAVSKRIADYYEKTDGRLSEALAADAARARARARDKQRKETKKNLPGSRE